MRPLIGVIKFMTNGKKRVVIRVGRVILRRTAVGTHISSVCRCCSSVHYTSLEVMLIQGVIISLTYLYVLVTPKHPTIILAECIYIPIQVIGTESR